MEKRSFLFFVGFTWSSFGKILELVILFFFFFSLINLNYGLEFSQS